MLFPAWCQIMLLAGLWLWHSRSHSAFTSQPNISTFQFLLLKFPFPSCQKRSVFVQIFRLIKDLSLTTDSNTSTTTSPSSSNTSALPKDTVAKIWDADNGCLYVNVKGHQFKKQPLEFRITANMFFSVSSLEKLQALQEEKIYLIKPVSLIHWYRLIA